FEHHIAELSQKQKGDSPPAVTLNMPGTARAAGGTLRRSSRPPPAKVPAGAAPALQPLPATTGAVRPRRLRARTPSPAGPDPAPPPRRPPPPRASVALRAGGRQPRRDGSNIAGTR